MIGQLGYGANPLDMFTFTDPSDQREYLAVTIDTRGAAKIATSELDTAPAQPTGGAIDFAPRGLGLTQTLMPVHSDHTAMINSKWRSSCNVTRRRRPGATSAASRDLTSSSAKTVCPR